MSSPLILQRSGIGDPAKLRAAGVKPIVDLPGVGLNFQDHYLTFSLYRAKPGVESFDDFARGDPATQKRTLVPETSMLSDDPANIKSRCL